MPDIRKNIKRKGEKICRVQAVEPHAQQTAAQLPAETVEAVAHPAQQIAVPYVRVPAREPVRENVKIPAVRSALQVAAVRPAEAVEVVGLPALITAVRFARNYVQAVAWKPVHQLAQMTARRVAKRLVQAVAQMTAQEAVKTDAVVAGMHAHIIVMGAAEPVQDIAAAVMINAQLHAVNPVLAVRDAAVVAQRAVRDVRHPAWESALNPVQTVAPDSAEVVAPVVLLTVRQTAEEVVKILVMEL